METGTTLVLLVIITGVILPITLIVAYLFFKRWIGFCRVALKDVAEALGAEPSLDMWNISASVHGRIQGRPVSVKFTNQTRSSPPSVTVSVPAGSGASMTARRPNFLDRWCAAVGLAFPIVTGDPRIDGRIQVDTGDREKVHGWLADARFREGLLKLFDPDMMRVVRDNGGLSLVRKLKPKETVDPSKVFKPLPRLLDLAQYMTRTADPTAQWRPSTNRVMLRWGLGPGLVLLTGIILIIAGMSLYETLFPAFWQVAFWALPWSLSAAAVYCLAAWLFVKARTDRHLVILVIVALALPACCIGATGWRYFGNGSLDKGAPGKIDAVVWETLNKGRGGRKIVFMVDGRPSAEFPRPRGAYPRGLPVELTVYPGCYGITWVDQWQVRDKNSKKKVGKYGM